MIVNRARTWRLIAPRIVRPLLAHVAWAAVVALAHAAGVAWTSFPALPISLLAATLGVLIGFRNTSGYDRWWEARTLWGGVVNQSRTFARQVLTFLPSAPERAAALRDAARRPGVAAAGEAPTAAVVRTRLVETALAVAGETLAHGRAHAGGSGDGAVRDPDGQARPDRRVAARGALEHTVAGGSPAARDGDGMGDRAWNEAARAADGAGDDGERCHFAQASAEARELVHAQIGFVTAMRCHLRRQDPIPEMAPFLRPAVLDALRDEQNVPSALLAWMAIRLRRLLDGSRPDDVFRLTALDATLGELTNLLGGCERIKNTPIPRQYDLLIRVMVRAYLLLLPFGLVQDLGLATPLVTAVLGAIFLGLDMVGRSVECPFEDGIHDTPMTALCRTIEINLRQMLGETALPAPVEPENGVLY